MKIFTTQSTKLLDRLTIEYEPVSSIDLMERAAEALTSEICNTISPSQRIYIFAGPGNNGGDALATARLLIDRGYKPVVYLFNTMPNHRLSADCEQTAGCQFRRLRDRRPLRGRVERTLDRRIRIFGTLHQ